MDVSMEEDRVLIEAKQLSYQYEDGTEALKDITLHIRRGERIAVLGANGSGKSTFFLCLMGILKPKKGSILFGGSPIEYSRKGLCALREKIGMVFQEPDHQLFSASVYQEISFGPMNLGWEKERVRQAVETSIERMQIRPFQDKAVHFLSGGQKKQVSIADIIAMEPEVIIMDEPTSALDPRHSLRVQEMIHQLSDSGITVIIATHDGDYAMEWGERILLFHEGRIERTGTPMEVFRDRELLKRTHQMPPKVLEIYDVLTQKGLIERTEVIPKSIKELQTYIAQM